MTKSTTPLTVLVMDDEPTVCRSVEKILTRRGYRVSAASSVAGALDLLDAGRHVDLVLADLMMPGVPGMEFIRIAAERWPRLPIVVITGYASVASAVEATRLGAEDYLAKPFTPEELEMTVARALGRGPWKTPVQAAPSRPRPSGAAASVIDVDLPFDPDEVAQVTSAAYVERLTRSDMPILEFCAPWTRRSARVAAPGARCEIARASIAAERRHSAAIPSAAGADEPIDVDLPFSAREVAAVTGEAYIRALGRSDVPVTGRWPKEVARRRRVLAVDDEAVVVRAMRRSLDGRRYRVDEAFSGRDALARVVAQPYDLVLLDMRMPDLDGLDLLPKIREHQPGVPVVIVTGYASIDTAVEAIQRGAADYLPKPFTPDELRRVADRALRRVA